MKHVVEFSDKQKEFSRGNLGLIIPDLERVNPLLGILRNVGYSGIKSVLYFSGLPLRLYEYGYQPSYAQKNGTDILICAGSGHTHYRLDKIKDLFVGKEEIIPALLANERFAHHAEWVSTIPINLEQSLGRYLEQFRRQMKCKNI